MSSFGLARTDGSFIINEATVMISEDMNDLYNMTETESMGLVKNFRLQTTPQEAELTQGVDNTVVDTTRTGNAASGGADLFEFTPTNMLRMMGGDTSGLISNITDDYVLNAALAGGETTITITDAADNSADFPAGTWIMIENSAAPNSTHFTQLSGNATHAGGVTTLPIAGIRAIGASTSFPVATSRVQRVNAVVGGQKILQKTYALKVITETSAGNKIGILIPKVKFNEGLQFQLGTQEYRSTPAGFTVYDLVSTDPLYGEFANNGNFIILSAV